MTAVGEPGTGVVAGGRRGAPRTNLPLQLAPLVGRTDASTAVKELVARNRLVTLIGPGGVGKTRLAIDVAGQLVEAYRDGAWMVDLSAVGPGLVASAAAASMDIPESPRTPLVEAVGHALSGLAIVVVLDNCEHVLDEAADVAEALVRAGVEVHVLATSREPLGVAGEVVYPVPPLRAPDTADDVESPAVELFLDRARAAFATFDIDDDDLRSVVEICQHLDGLPLAIELAAARVRAMAPRDIAAQLATQLNHLGAARPRVAARHRTLDASVRWSYELLSAAEQVLLRRVAVFAGGFTLTAAQHVAGAGPGKRGEHDVGDLVTRLVDRSLVQAHHRRGSTRYRLLETVREFALEQLVDAGELTSARDGQLAHVIEMARRASRPLDLDVLVDEVDNIRAALDWAVECARAGSAAAILGLTSSFWAMRHLVEGERHVAEVLALDHLSAVDAARLHMLQSWFAFWRGDLDAGRARTADASARAKDAGHEALVLETIAADALYRAVNGDQSAVPTVEAAIAVLEPTGATVELTHLHYGRSTAALAVGDLKTAHESVLRGVANAEEAGDPLVLSGILSAAADIALTRGDLDAVERHGRRSLEAGGRHGGVFIGDTVRVQLAVAAAIRANDGDLAAFHEAVAVAIGNASVVGGATGLWYAAELARRFEDGIDVAALRRSVLQATFAGIITAPMVDVFVACVDAEEACTRGDPKAAVAAAQRAVDIVSAEPRGRAIVPLAHSTYARAWLVSGDARRAEVAAHAALDLHHTADCPIGVAESLELLACIGASASPAEEAARLLGAAAAVRSELGYPIGPKERRWTDEAEARLRAVLGDAAVEAAHADGLAMSADEAVALARRGRGPRSRAAFGWESLSRAELDVARLAGEGLKNREIGEKLFMAPGTVRTHLTHIFTKLGVSTRAELAAYVAGRRP